MTADEGDAAGRLFDRYLVVDWSASARPKRGKDSIWICEIVVGSDALVANPPTRARAEAIVRESLVTASERRERTLVCFDFPYAYPQGFASALGLTGDPWRALWTFLRDRVEDDPRSNRNNRFDVASEINRRLGAHVYWGAPVHRSLSHLSSRRDLVGYRIEGGSVGLAEWREVEALLRTRGGRPHSVWQLLGAGSVGSQTLVGIPVVARLRDDPSLSEISQVWPFEVAVPRVIPGRPAVVHAEVWPSLTETEVGAGRVKDEVQVRTVAHELLRKDRAGSLARLFEAASPASREEGWILGVT